MYNKSIFCIYSLISSIPRALGYDTSDKQDRRLCKILSYTDVHSSTTINPSSNRNFNILMRLELSSKLEWLTLFTCYKQDGCISYLTSSTLMALSHSDESHKRMPTYVNFHQYGGVCRDKVWVHLA